MIAAAAVSLFLLIASQVAIEMLRDRVDARRVRERGIGGTQDVFLWSLPVTLALTVVTIVFLYLAVMEVRELKKSRGLSLSRPELRTTQC